jgi:WD40 repeat protein
MFFLLVLILSLAMLSAGPYAAQAKQMHYEKFKTLTGHTGDVQCIAFSRDGRLMASFAPKMNFERGPFCIPIPVPSASDTCDIILWDTQSWKVSDILSGRDCDINQVSFDPGGKYLVTAGKMLTVYRSE